MTEISALIGVRYSCKFCVSELPLFFVQFPEVMVVKKKRQLKCVKRDLSFNSANATDSAEDELSKIIKRVKLYFYVTNLEKGA